MKALLTVQEKILENLWAVMMMYGGRTAERGFGPTSQGKSKETKYARWPLPANAVNKTSHYLIASDTSKKDRNYATYSGPVP